ncbi:hypothetical protein [Pontixanthobacter luteolus]|uniref:hypothetical protein n=1 Tax=Pontixanthobacter luteolus TaxID=295089 RepID=UPI0023026303|nr:hypothetical protein [Pontixanthobacter luteolus]
MFELPKVCDLSAVHEGLRNQSIDRERPPACALPTAETIAQACAIHDQVRDPSYNPTYDELGYIRSAPPLPEYLVSDLQCRFTSAEENEANCSFGLALPGEERGARQVEARFENRYWQLDTIISHSRGVHWFLRDDCTPDPDGDV